MIGERLSQIRLSEFLVHFVFDSEGCVDAYSRVTFRDANELVLSSFTPEDPDPVSIPHRRFLGQRVTSSAISPGRFVMNFNMAGSVEIARIGNEIEIGLIAVNDCIEVLK